LHLLSAAEAGSVVCVLTNPVWLVKTRLQLQGPAHGTHQPYTGFYDALRSILKEEGWRGLYKGLGPGLVLVSHGALQFMAYEEGRKLLIAYRSQKSTDQLMNTKGEDLLVVTPCSL
jgi:solute carrier family 25 folate transporter 32